MWDVSYTLAVFPDASLHPVAIPKDRVIDGEIFYNKFNFDGYAPYLIYPSWCERLPEYDKIQIEEWFEDDPVHFRIQFLPSTYPHLILKFQPKTNQNIQLKPWALGIVDRDSQKTFDDVIRAMDSSFCVEHESLTFEFPEETIQPGESVLSQKDAFKKSEIILNVVMNEAQAKKTRKRREAMKELLETERNYVKEMILMEQNFTEKFFADLHMDPDFYTRTFKSITDIRPLHEGFLEELEAAGVDPESSVGALFLKYVPFFKVASPHVSNFRSTNREITELLKTNKQIHKAVSQICMDVFDGKTVESLIVTPVQRIPRYPLLLSTLKETVANHRDRMDLAAAVDDLHRLSKDIDQVTRDQEERNMTARLQAEIGGKYQLVTGNRHYLFHLLDLNLSDGGKASVYLFNDLVLSWHTLPTEKFIDFQMARTRVFHDKGNLVIRDKLSIMIPESEKTHEFLAKFKDAKSKYIMKRCTFANSLGWIHEDHAYGPGSLQGHAMVSIFHDLYIFGGKRDNGTISNELWWYHNDAWHKLKAANPPTPRFDMSMHIYEAQLVIFGGQNGTDFFNDLYIFDIPTMTWSKREIEGAPSPRCGHAAAFITTQLWLFGGKNEDTFFNDFYCCDLYENKWYQIKTRVAPESRAWASAFWINDGGEYYFTVFGGASQFAALNNFWMFEYETSEWNEPIIEGDIPGVRYGHTSIVYDKNIYIIGGKNMKGDEVDSFCISLVKSPYQSVLIPQTNEPDRFEYGTGAVFKNFGLVLYGGNTGDASHGLWKIRLTTKVDLDTSFATLSREASFPMFRTAMSPPIYDAKAQYVTATLDDVRSSFSFCDNFDSSKLSDISRVKQVYFWRRSVLESIIDYTPVKERVLDDHVFTSESHAEEDEHEGDVVL